MLALQKECQFRLDESYLKRPEETVEELLRRVLQPGGYHVVARCYRES